MISRALAKYLDAKSLATYRPAGCGDCFLEHLPDDPDVALQILSTGGNPTPAASTWGYNEPTVQLLTRGVPEDAESPLVWATRLYDELQGLRYLTLDDGGEDEAYLVECSSLQTAPVNIGPDEKGRYRYSLNFALHVRALTAHRN
jgi:hypothetical protein